VLQQGLADAPNMVWGRQLQERESPVGWMPGFVAAFSLCTCATSSLGRGCGAFKKI